MQVTLTPELERLIRQKVEEGLYESESEVVREALRLLEERDELRLTKLRALKAALAEGITDLEAGRSGPFDVEAIKSEGRRLLRPEDRRG